jgi:hypothetical protein
MPKNSAMPAPIRNRPNVKSNVFAVFDNIATVEAARAHPENYKANNAPDKPAPCFSHALL